MTDHRCRYHGEGRQPSRTDKRVIKAMYKGFDFLEETRGVALRALNVVPHGRGLGYRLAIVGGLSLARALVLGGNERMTMIC